MLIGALSTAPVGVRFPVLRVIGEKRHLTLVNALGGGWRTRTYAH
jgi:hypothetical protein